MSQGLLRAPPAAVASGTCQLWSLARVSLPPVQLGFLSALRALPLAPLAPLPAQTGGRPRLDPGFACPGPCVGARWVFWLFVPSAVWGTSGLRAGCPCLSPGGPWKCSVGAGGELFLEPLLVLKGGRVGLFAGIPGTRPQVSSWFVAGCEAL